MAVLHRMEPIKGAEGKNFSFKQFKMNYNYQENVGVLMLRQRCNMLEDYPLKLCMLTS